MSDVKVTYLDMKTVIEVNDYESAQRYIDDGWYLLSVGFDAGEYGSTQVYILGNTAKIVREKTKIEVILSEDS
ncbi:MAG TPA: hypothetical protein VN549_03710 [Negativicutes bacterium]|nr:hypothetical protein [Negativicutes bacterium]